MPEFHQRVGRKEPTFKGNAPTGEKSAPDDVGPDAVPGIDVGASELPTRGDLGFPGSPNETPEDQGKGPVDVAEEPPLTTEDSPR